jgi:hypothetical protein
MRRIITASRSYTDTDNQTEGSLTVKKPNTGKAPVVGWANSSRTEVPGCFTGKACTEVSGCFMDEAVSERSESHTFDRPKPIKVSEFDDKQNREAPRVKRPRYLIL